MTEMATNTFVWMHKASNFMDNSRGFRNTATDGKDLFHSK